MVYKITQSIQSELMLGYILNVGRGRGETNDLINAFIIGCIVRYAIHY